jgi:DNA-binding XRE family transcriptional regulator
MDQKSMTRQEFIALRKALGLNQTEMGEAIGLSLRAYGNLETGESEIRKLHVLAAERVALSVAVENNDPMLAPIAIRRDAVELARALVGER